MVGIIDSGSGGFNVIKECNKYFKEDYIYIFDNLNSPYGNLSAERVVEITKKNIDYLLSNYNLDFIIVACNTASSLFDLIDYKNQIPILKTNPNLTSVNDLKSKTLVFATKNTIYHNKSVKFYLQNFNNLKTLYIKNLPKLIDNYIEQKTYKNYNKIVTKLKHYFCHKNKLKNKYKNVKYLSLGCTHFRHIEPILLKIFNHKINILYCEHEVAKNAQIFVRKNKQKTSIKIIKTSVLYNLTNKFKV